MCFTLFYYTKSWDHFKLYGKLDNLLIILAYLKDMIYISNDNNEQKLCNIMTAVLNLSSLEILLS